MSCTMSTLAACFSLSGIHLDAGIAYMAPVKPAAARCAGAGLGAGCAWKYDINYVSNPYGTAALGYSVDAGPVTWDLQLRHQSSIPAGDHGENLLQLSVSWRPWGRS